ncbi:MAG: hypothetical protein AB7F76_07160 [Parvibaculaceae bacterium]|jgi:hypothetical protein
MIRWGVVLCALVLTGCATKLLDDNYAGPTAIVKDTVTNYDEGTWIRPASVQIYVLSHVDGTYIETASAATANATFKSSLGFGLTPKSHERRVPIKPMTIVLQAIMDYEYPREPIIRARRELKFHPKAGQVYYVRGRIEPENSSVWIENANGQRVTD